jgi:ketosteroid isomerase-like protein
MFYKTVSMFLVLALAISGLVMGTEITAAAGNEEEAIKAVIQEFVKLYNSKDSKAIISLYHAKAKIKTGMGSNQRIVSREEYADIAPTRANQFGTLTLKNFDEVKTEGNKATVEAIIVFNKTGAKLPMTFSMVLEEGKWLIMVQDY